MTQKCEFCARRRVCPCEQKAVLTETQNTPVMAFIPWQTDGKLYCDAQALMRGTLFAVLDKPFYGTGGCCSGK
ncbi:MAG: spore coat associated protein CotJA [Clostridia bacterium]|nr:spore coat associated protein CotJA [Oscillospiraceae bacterium]MBQ6796681.1 spore coat associated protein CotJA [Clostridia bacterium]